MGNLEEPDSPPPSIGSEVSDSSKACYTDILITIMERYGLKKKSTSYQTASNGIIG
jgi:hypothetical protein